MSLTVAIVGRPNVGKSSLFNRLIGLRLSITDDVAGITRDRLYYKTNYRGHDLNLIDTGGLSKDKVEFIEEITFQTSVAIDEAQVIVFVTDVTTGITDNDYFISKMLLKSNKPVIVAVNKVDNVELSYNVYDFYKLGFTKVYGVSTIHQIGVEDLLEEIVALDKPGGSTVEDNKTITFGFFGKPNVGKSSIINKIIREKRVVESPIAGTTTDSININFRYKSESFTIIDTAGIRQKSRFETDLEKYSLLRTMIALSRVDVALLVLDISEKISELDKIICSYLVKAKKALIIVANKTDLLEDAEKEIKEFTKEVEDKMFVTSYAKILLISAKVNVKTNQIMDEIISVYQNYTKEIKTAVLNNAINEIVTNNPPTIFNGGIVKCLYMTQTDIKPPSFTLFINRVDFFHFSYERYLTNQIRKYFGLMGTPIIINAVERKQE